MFRRNQGIMISYVGKKVRLRPLRHADKAKTLAWRNDPEVREYMLGYRFPVTEPMEERWFENVLDDQTQKRVVFAIESLQDSVFIGITQLYQIDWISRLCFFGITIGEKDYHRLGLGRDSMHILFNYAFDGLNLRKICLEVVAYNKAAVQMYREFGFIEEGVLKQQVYLKGSYHDLILMRLLVDEFRQLDQ